MSYAYSLCVCERWIKAPKLRHMTAPCMKMDCPSPHVISILRRWPQAQKQKRRLAWKKLRPFSGRLRLLCHAPLILKTDCLIELSEVIDSCRLSGFRTQ